MENVAKVMPILWGIIDRNKKCSINVTSKDNEISVSILSGRKWKRFKNKNTSMLINEIGDHYVER